MDLLKVETKVKYHKCLVTALQVDVDETLVMIGSFDDYLGLDYKKGKSTLNYTRFDLPSICTTIGLDNIRDNADLRQFVFDMFMGAFIYLTKDCLVVQRLLTQRTTSYLDDSKLVWFFGDLWTASGMPRTIDFSDVSVNKYLDNIKVFNSAPNNVSGLNKLPIYTYANRSERDWINSLPHTPWCGVDVMSSEVKDKLTGRELGSVYFSNNKVVVTSGNWYAEYELPVVPVDSTCYCLIVDTLLPMVKELSGRDLTDISTYTVIEEVFDKFKQG